MFTEEYEFNSDTATFTLADVPDAPSSGPVRESTSDDTTLKITIGEVTATNGAAIESYEISIDKNDGNSYVVAQESMALTATISGLTKGETYKVRYRAANAKGYGDYSAVTYMLAATTPTAPSAPTFTSSTATDLVIGLDTSTDNGGDSITSYTLYINAGDDSEPTTSVASYNSGDVTHTLNDVTDSLTAGKVYLIKFSATNSIGESAKSNALQVALIASPSAPASLTRVESSSSTTQIGLTWASVADSAAPGGTISGYQLYMATGASGSYSLYYDGDGFPTITSKIVTGLTQGQQYRFKVLALNFNGASAYSSELSTYSCVAPSNMAAPTRTASTTS